MKYKSPHLKLRKKCDALWSLIIQKRAGNKSEYSGRTENLVSHHLRGKKNYRQRYDLDNGYCLTAGEHSFIFHNSGRRPAAEIRVKRQRGRDIFEYLETLGWDQCKTRLRDVEIFLKNELEKSRDG